MLVHGLANPVDPGIATDLEGEEAINQSSK